MIRTLGTRALQQLQEVVRRVLPQRPGKGARPSTPRVVDGDRHLGKTSAAIAKGATGTVAVYTGRTKGSETASGLEVEAYNRYADLGSGKWCRIEWVLGGWELYVAECDE